MTPTDLEKAIDITINQIRRRRIDKTTGETVYDPPYTAQDFEDGMWAGNIISQFNNAQDQYSNDPTFSQDPKLQEAIRRANRFCQSKVFKNGPVELVVGPESKSGKDQKPAAPTSLKT